MATDGAALVALIEAELAGVQDERVVQFVRKLLVHPTPQERAWDYGEPGQKFSCWIVLADEEDGTAIAYCDQGFGPKSPWGLLWLSPDRQGGSMGMDSGWFPTFMEAFFESGSAIALPIWRVVEGTPGQFDFLSEEMSWEAASAKATSLRQPGFERRFWVHHSIRYG